MASSSNEVKSSTARKFIVPIAMLVLGIGVSAAAAYYFLGNSAAHAEAPAAPADPIFVALEPFTVNLQPDARSRFLHVGVTLKVNDAASQEQVTKYLPEVRSRILSVLSNREAASLLAPEQKTKLANELLTALKQPFIPSLPPAKIASIMFTAFILQ